MAETIFESSIASLQAALSAGSLTSVELLAKHLLRIATYDCRGPCLNSIPILNSSAFDEAAASDARRATGRTLGPLDGIPYTLKDSIKYKGMTCSTGSPAFVDLVASDDSFVARRLRDAGAVCIGRTNTPPMMASGMHRGAYGRAERPYNLDYLTAAFSSGSSNGSGTSTAASFATFSLGSETLSSGRSPASNNGLVAYTPSRTVISLRGTWPLYMTCDVIVPHTRSMEDMLTILDVLTSKDEDVSGDFWRAQKLIDIEEVPLPDSFLNLRSTSNGIFQGKTIAVPAMYIGKPSEGRPTYVSPDIIELWKQAEGTLIAMGAKVIHTGFPLVTNYEAVPEQTMNVVGIGSDWHAKERGELVSYGWDDFLKANGDPHVPNLGSVDGTRIFPDRPDGYLPDVYLDRRNFLDYPRLVRLAQDRPPGKSMFDIHGLGEALKALEAQRKRDLEDWMDRKGVDIVAFPANGDVGRADLEVNADSAKHALLNGVRVSNGNRAIRHLGVPTVSVTVGIIKGSGMPVNLTFAGKHGQDADLLRYVNSFEQHTPRRVPPTVTPPLSTDRIHASLRSGAGRKNYSSLSLEVMSAECVGEAMVEVKGQVTVTSDEHVSLEVFVDGTAVQDGDIMWEDNSWVLRTPYQPFKARTPPYGGVGQVVNNVSVILLARSSSQVKGKMILIDQQPAVNV